MAVQAQYPSNFLFSNRNGQEGHDYTLQPQQGGVLDQTHMLFNNGGDNPRKRGREISSFSVNNGMNTQNFSMQSQPPQVIDLSLLHNQTPPSTGLRLCSGEEQIPNNNSGFHHYSYQNHHHHHHHHHHNQQQRQIPVSNSSGYLSLFSEDISAHIKRQNEELDGFIQAQGEELRRTLADRSQMNYRALIRAVEEPLTRRLTEKEAEMQRATRRREELEARAAQLAADVQAWQIRARSQEAAAVSLQAQLQKATAMAGRAAAAYGGGRVQGEEGMFFSRDVEADDEESVYIDPERVVAAPEMTVVVCKECQRRSATVVLLPCRHLCLCPECDRTAIACPVCLTLRNSSVEAVLC